MIPHEAQNPNTEIFNMVSNDGRMILKRTFFIR